MSNQDSSEHTPITDLLAVAQAMVTYLKEAGHPDSIRDGPAWNRGHTPDPDGDPELGPHGPCLLCRLVVDADAAIARATKGGAREQESPSITQ